ncbi:hypothetical protein [Listeria cornellensis]|uniref:Uncharacterized protein n=1 Tax=Listeria cornellensis FSL F6-0969 TaxID=1265820 RepID=W7BYS3_9LIST|nr:hypothetical protein [Listeria cornellensis]EUJ25368.1 hypothetical protein PCORN_17554 [Listeria cornellensis FSL F6-0969]
MVEVHGLHAHFVLMHIEALNQQMMLHKSHNKAETARLASTEIVRGRSENPLLVFAEATKFPRGWLLKLDLKTTISQKTERSHKQDYRTRTTSNQATSSKNPF